MSGETLRGSRHRRKSENLYGLSGMFGVNEKSLLSVAVLPSAGCESRYESCKQERVPYPHYPNLKS